ncbi:MAG: hypothetical protein F4X08_10585 [Gemmatimonadetes bacterium]|nr:hypothetical protein [Gemmatimonadota bacterium]MYD26248.1 hypothetical protein [Gemmatimonadota bacterium]
MPDNTSGRHGWTDRHGRTGRFWILACLGLLLLSCRPPPPAPPPLPVELLLQEIEAASRRLQDFRGSAGVETSFAGHRGRASLRIRYLSPARFRIDVHGALFEILAVVLIHDLRVRLYMPRENTVFEGTLETRDASIPGLDVTLDDVHTAVTGTIAPGRYQGLPVTDYRRDGNTAAVTLGDDSGRRTLWIDTDRMTVTREASESPVNQGSVTRSITRTFDRFRNRNGVWRPEKVRITRDGPRAGTFELTYRTQSINRGLRPSDIGVRLPETVVRRPLEEAGTVFETVDGAP